MDSLNHNNSADALSHSPLTSALAFTPSDSNALDVTGSADATDSTAFEVQPVAGEQSLEQLLVDCESNIQHQQRIKTLVELTTIDCGKLGTFQLPTAMLDLQDAPSLVAYIIQQIGNLDYLPTTTLKSRTTAQHILFTSSVIKAIQNAAVAVQKIQSNTDNILLNDSNRNISNTSINSSSSNHNSSSSSSSSSTNIAESVLSVPSPSRSSIHRSSTTTLKHLGLSSSELTVNSLGTSAAPSVPTLSAISESAAPAAEPVSALSAPVSIHLNEAIESKPSSTESVSKELSQSTEPSPPRVLSPLIPFVPTTIRPSPIDLTELIGSSPLQSLNNQFTEFIQLPGSPESKQSTETHSQSQSVTLLSNSSAGQLPGSIDTISTLTENQLPSFSETQSTAASKTQSPGVNQSAEDRPVESAASSISAKQLNRQWDLNLAYFVGHAALLRYASYVHLLLMIHQISRLPASEMHLIPGWKEGQTPNKTALECAIAWGMHVHNRSAEKQQNVSMFKSEAKKHFALISYLHAHPWELFFYFTSRIPIPLTLIRELPADTSLIKNTLSGTNFILTLLKDSNTSGVGLTPATAIKHVKRVFKALKSVPALESKESTDAADSIAISVQSTPSQPRQLRLRKLTESTGTTVTIQTTEAAESIELLSQPSSGFVTPVKDLSKVFTSPSVNNSDNEMHDDSHNAPTQSIDAPVQFKHTHSTRNVLAAAAAASKSLVVASADPAKPFASNPTDITYSPDRSRPAISGSLSKFMKDASNVNSDDTVDASSTTRSSQTDSNEPKQQKNRDQQRQRNQQDNHTELDSPKVPASRQLKIPPPLSLSVSPTTERAAKDVYSLSTDDGGLLGNRITRQSLRKESVNTQQTGGDAPDGDEHNNDNESNHTAESNSIGLSSPLAKRASSLRLKAAPSSPVSDSDDSMAEESGSISNKPSHQRAKSFKSSSFNKSAKSRSSNNSAAASSKVKLTKGLIVTDPTDREINSDHSSESEDQDQEQNDNNDTNSEQDSQTDDDEAEIKSLSKPNKAIISKLAIKGKAVDKVDNKSTAVKETRSRKAVNAPAADDDVDADLDADGDAVDFGDLSSSAVAANRTPMNPDPAKFSQQTSRLLLQFQQIVLEIKQLMSVMQSPENDIVELNTGSNSTHHRVCSSSQHHRWCVHHRDAQQRAVALFEQLAADEPRAFYAMLQEYYTDWSDRAQVHLYFHQLIRDYSVFFPVLAAVQARNLNEYQAAIEHYLMEPHGGIELRFNTGAAFIRPSYLRDHPEYLRQLPAWNSYASSTHSTGSSGSAASNNSSMKSAPTKYWIYCPDWHMDKEFNETIEAGRHNRNGADASSKPFSAGQLDPHDSSKFTSSAFLRLSKAAFPLVDLDGTTGFPMLPLKLLLDCGLVMVLYPQLPLDTMCVAASIKQQQMHCVVTETGQPLVSSSCNVYSITHCCEHIIEQVQLPLEQQFQSALLEQQPAVQKYLRAHQDDYPEYVKQCPKDKQKRLIYQQQRLNYTIDEFDAIMNPLLNAGTMTEEQIKTLYPQFKDYATKQLPCLAADRQSSWLNDSHIEICLQHIQLQIEAQHPAFAIDIVAPTNPKYIIDHCADKDPQTWLKKIQLSAHPVDSSPFQSTHPSSIVVLPLCIEENHYVVLLADSHYQKPHLYLFDPFGCTVYKATLLRTQTGFAESTEELESAKVQLAASDDLLDQALKVLGSAIHSNGGSNGATATQSTSNCRSYKLCISRQKYQNDTHNCGIWIINFIELYLQWKLNHPLEVLEDIAPLFEPAGALQQSSSSTGHINTIRQRYCAITQRNVQHHPLLFDKTIGSVHSTGASTPITSTGHSATSSHSKLDLCSTDKLNTEFSNSSNTSAASWSSSTKHTIQIVSPEELQFAKEYTFNVPEKERNDRLRRAAWSIDTIPIENNLMAIDKELNRYRALALSPPRSYLTHLNQMCGYLWQKYLMETEQEDWYQLWTAASALAQKCTILLHTVSTNSSNPGCYSIHQCSPRFGCWHTLPNHSANAHIYIEHNSIIRPPLSVRIARSPEIDRLTGTLAEQIKVAVQTQQVELELNHTATGDHHRNTDFQSTADDLTAQHYIQQIQLAELPKKEYSFIGENQSKFNYQDHVGNRDCPLYLADIAACDELSKQLWNAQFAQFVGRSTAAGLLNHYVVNKTHGVQEPGYYYSVPGPLGSAQNCYAHCIEPHCESGHLASVHTYLHTDPTFGDVWSHSGRILPRESFVAAFIQADQKWIYAQVVSSSEQKEPEQADSEHLVYTIQEFNDTSDGDASDTSQMNQTHQVSGRFVISIPSSESYPKSSRLRFQPGQSVIVLQSRDPIHVQEATVVEYHNDTQMYSLRIGQTIEHNIPIDNVAPLPENIVVSAVLPTCTTAPASSGAVAEESAEPKGKGRSKKLKVDHQELINSNQQEESSVAADADIAATGSNNKPGKRTRSPAVTPEAAHDQYSTRTTRTKRKL